MSYYKYLQRYSPSFLRKYQCEQYAHLSRSSRYADIVHSNSTQTLSIDEDLSLNLSVPFNINNFLAFVALIYWYFYHVDMYSANSLKNRLRSYHNYRMWSRLEVTIAKNNVEPGKPTRKLLEDMWLANKNITREQIEEISERTENGESVSDILTSWGMKYDALEDRLVKL
jgi:hypothetical protein